MNVSTAVTNVLAAGGIIVLIGRRAKKLAASSNKRATVFPDMRNEEAVQRFFLQEVQLGEELLAAGDVENGIDHIGNAVVVCGRPNDILNLLQQTLQPQAFHLLIQRLPSITSRMAGAAPKIHEEEVE